MHDVVGRDSEIEALNRWFTGSAATCLVLEGEAGIGKTTLWLAAVESSRSRGTLVLVSTPAEAEARLSYAGLADLLADSFPSVRPELPEPQARALAIALRLEEPGARPVDETAVARGLLLALRLLARQHGALIVAIDDLRWLDQPTLSALTFALRRLEPADRVKLLTTHRFGAVEPVLLAGGDTVERLRLGPVSLGGLHRILRLRIGRAMARPALLELYRISSGNPLHAIELARAVESSVHGETSSVIGLLRARLAALPERTRRAMLLMAASGDPSTERLTRAWGPEFAASLGPALDDGIVIVAFGAFRPAHPLFARLAYDDAPPEARRAAHRSLAASASTDEERVTHLGRSVDTPDADIARELEQAAIDARRRGVRSVSASLFDRSVQLTPTHATDDRARRSLAAASAWFEAGDLGLAERRLTELLSGEPSLPIHAEARLQLGIVLHEAGRWHEAMARFTDALGEADDPRIIAETHRRMAISLGYTGTVAEAIDHLATAKTAAEASGDRDTLTYCLATLALAHVMGGSPRTAWGLILDRALEIERGLDHPLTGWTPRLVAAEEARLSLEIDRARDLYAEVLDQAVAIGDATLEHWAAYGLGSTELLAGDYRRAGELADLALELAETTGVVDIYARRLRGQVDAHLGQAPEARNQVLAALAAAQARGGRLHELGCHVVLGQLALASGDAAVAAGDLRAARIISLEMGFWNGVTIRAVLDEAEAAAAAGLGAQAEEVLDMVARRLVEEVPGWAAPLLERAKGLLLAAQGDIDGAERLLADSARSLQGGPVPLDEGRALLVLGSVQRRGRHYGAAHASLDAAVAVFEELGAALWATRARRELARIPGRRTHSSDELTEAEERIAALVARGRSNREVAAELFLSVKTVEVTLTGVYQKLGVRSRAELAAGFATISTTDAAAKPDSSI